MDQIRHHVIVSGTGRAGTTFLIQLLTKLGLPTGFSPKGIEKRVNQNSNAGLEKDIRKPNAPYIVKNPSMALYIDKIIEDYNIVIDHAFILVRDLESAAESRRLVTQKAGNVSKKIIPGGLAGTKYPKQQENVLARRFYYLMFNLAKKEIPITLIHYPKLTKDERYLFDKLHPILKNIDFELFSNTFAATVKKDLVHQFTDKDR